MGPTARPRHGCLGSLLVLAVLAGSAAWSNVDLLDMKLTDTKLKAWSGALVHGDYAYLVPFQSGSSNAHYGKVARFRLSTFDDVSFVDLQDHHEKLKGFMGGFSNGSHAFLAPFSSNGNPRSEMAVVDLDNFDLDHVRYEDLTTYDGHMKGFRGAFSDEAAYGYFVPNNKAKVARIAFRDGGITVLDLAASDAGLAGGFRFGFAAGGHGYLVPFTRGSGKSGKVARFDLATFSAVEVLDLTLSDADLKGLHGGFSDGRYGYMLGRNNGASYGKVARFDLASFGSVAVLDLKAVDADLKELTGGFVHGDWAYVVCVSSGKIASFSVLSFSPADVFIIDAQLADPNINKWEGVFTDGGGVFGYAFPNFQNAHGLVARFRLQTSTTTSSATTASTSTGDTTPAALSSAISTTVAGPATTSAPATTTGAATTIGVSAAATAAATTAAIPTTDSPATTTAEGSITTALVGSGSTGHAGSTSAEVSTTAGGFSSVAVGVTEGAAETSTGFAAEAPTSVEEGSTSEFASTAQLSTETSQTEQSSDGPTPVVSSTSWIEGDTTGIDTSTSIERSSDEPAPVVTSTNWIEGDTWSSTAVALGASTTRADWQGDTSRMAIPSTSYPFGDGTSLAGGQAEGQYTTSTVADTNTAVGRPSPTSGSAGAGGDFTTTTISSSSTGTTSAKADPASPTADAATSSKANLQTTSTIIDTAQAKSAAVSSALRDSVTSWLSAGTATGNFTASFDVGVVRLVALQEAQASGVPLTLGHRGGKVAFSAAVLRALPEQAVLAFMDIAGNNPFPSLGAIASSAIDLSVYDKQGRPVLVTLNEPMLFKLPSSESSQAADVECVYLDVSGPRPRWSTEGVWRASAAEVLAAGEDPEGIWCHTKHLSIFAAVLKAVLGCTNLELLSEGALRAIVENEDWHVARSATITFVIWALLAALVVLGVVHECWALRLGRTPGKSKPVNICRRFLNWGPQMIKHKYTVFVVYTKDLLRCITTGRLKLKHSVLTSSVQRFLAVRTNVSVACVTAHCWNGGNWIETTASIPNAVLCRKLEFHAGAADSVIQEEIFGPGPEVVLRRFALNLLALHPLLDAMRLGAGSLTCAKRTVLQVAGISGVLASNAMIFNFSGDLQSWEAEAECPIPHTSQLFVLVASSVSLLLNAVPNAFLLDLAKQVYGRPGWTLVFWLWTLAYLSMAVLLIVTALANLNRKDQAKWYKSLEWAMSLKLLCMPAAQALRNSLMLELFMREDRRAPAAKRFRAVIGLSHHREAELPPEALRAAEAMASRAISAGELLGFFALLGEGVMPDFDAELSTSDDVLHRAVEPLCVAPPALEAYPVRVEVLQVCGLQHPPRRLVCCVLHLGELVKGAARPELHRQCSAPVLAAQGCCCWQLQTSVLGLAPEQGLAFTVMDVAGFKLGTAWLTAEEVLRAGGWSGELRLHPADVDADATRDKATPVPARSFSGSQGLEGSPRPASLARLTVAVQLPEGYLPALALHERRKLRKEFPPHQSEAETGAAELRSLLVAQHIEVSDRPSGSSAGAFCAPWAHQDESLPPQRMVVHSRQGQFLQLVAAVLADALEGAVTLKAVAAMLRAKDFHGLQDMMQDAGCQGTRFWIEMFAMDPVEHCRLAAAGGDYDWHEGFMPALPTILRSMRQACCQKVVSDIRARRKVDSPEPLRQLLVLDQNFHFFREQGCLAELMLAASLHVKQDLILHPDHLSGSGLGQALQGLAKELGSSDRDQQPTAPYLEKRQAVYNSVRDLAIAGVKKQRGDDESVWQELRMSDVFVTVAAYEGQRGFNLPERTGDGTADAVLAEDMEVDADVDA